MHIEKRTVYINSEIPPIINVQILLRENSLHVHCTNHTFDYNNTHHIIFWIKCMHVNGWVDYI